MFCNTCWANLPDGTERCPKCGSDPRARGPISRPDVSKRRPPEKRTTPAPFPSRHFTAIVLLLIISGGVYYLYKEKAEERSYMTGEAAPRSVTSAPEFSWRRLSISTRREAPGPQAGSGPETGMPYIREAKEAFDRGDFLNSVRLLRDALALSPENEDIKMFLSVSLNNLAIKEMEQKDLAQAESLLEESLSLEDDPRHRKNLAIIKVRMGRLEEALDVLEPLASDSEAVDLLKTIYSRLGERYYREGRLDSALDVYKKLLAVDPSDSAAKAMVKRLGAEEDIERGFRSKEGSHFVVKFEGGENAEAGHIVSLILEEAYIKVGADLGYYPEGTIGAVLYSSEQFRDITRSPSWTGAIYDGRIKIPIGGITEKTELLTKVIFHEYTHALVHRVAGLRAPAWLNEGLAQYEEGRRSGMFRDFLKRAAEKGKISLSSLDRTFIRLGADRAREAYIYSLSATEYIIREFGLFSVMRILDALGRGLSLEEAMSGAIYLSREDFERLWLRSLRG